MLYEPIATTTSYTPGLDMHTTCQGHNAHRQCLAGCKLHPLCSDQLRPLHTHLNSQCIQHTGRIYLSVTCRQTTYQQLDKPHHETHAHSELLQAEYETSTSLATSAPSCTPKTHAAGTETRMHSLIPSCMSNRYLHRDYTSRHQRQ